MENKKMIALAIKELTQAKQNCTEWLDALETNILSCMEEYDPETRETLLDTSLEEIDYLSMNVRELFKLSKGVLECLEKSATQKTCKLELQNSNTKSCTNTLEEETKRLIMSYVNSLIN